MWSIVFEQDPLDETTHSVAVTDLSSCGSIIVKAKVNIKTLISSMTDDSQSSDKFVAFQEGGRSARTTLAHLFSLAMADSCPYISDQIDGNTNTSQSVCLVAEPLYFMRRWKKLRQLWKTKDELNGDSKAFNLSNIELKNPSRKLSGLFPPYIMERSDVWCDENSLNTSLVVMIDRQQIQETFDPTDKVKSFIVNFLDSIASKVIKENCFLSHVANTSIQRKIRDLLISLNAVAFIANGSIMPRRSGASFAPMSSPPAIPFVAPIDSNLTKQIKVKMGKLAPYVKNPNVIASSQNSDEFVINGMVIPKGVTLIVGGGYHGKSTMLRAIMTGVYDKILGDGRELCVTDIGAVSVRAEDGRYVNNTNVSAFISNLPIIGSDTRHFSTREASGSTSQASNVADAIEMEASALLVDEDVSAANFMSRDGRMRALVMDESITPLLYRVNGLYDKHGISSVVVVGGVGDWLDVPNAVIRLEKYIASDALEKAKSISYQFSYGHVQFGGRGVVHRLEWDNEGTPFRRRPMNGDKLVNVNNIKISLLDGCKFSLMQSCESNVEEVFNVFDNIIFNESLDEDVGTVDMTRCEQLLAGKHQLYGCAICAIWVLKSSQEYPSLDLNQLLDKLEEKLDGPYSFDGIIRSLCPHNRNLLDSLTRTLGYALRPRRYEIMMAISRMRGVEFEELPPTNDVLDEMQRKEREEEEKRRELAELWANRRKK